MPFSKIAHEAALAKVAAADATEVPDAIRAGFFHACCDLKLSQEQSARLGKFAAVALAVAAPKDGLAKIAADFSPADTQPADPAERLFRLELEAKQKGVPVEQLAAQQGINLVELQAAIKASNAGKTDAGKTMDAQAKATTAKTTVPGGADVPLSPYGAVSTPTQGDPGGLFGEPPAPAPAPASAPVTPAAKPAPPAPPVKPPTPVAPPTAPAPAPAPKAPAAPAAPGKP